MAAFCPTGGSYWNPKFCWWCTSSAFCTVLTRVYDVVRIGAWVLGRVVDFFLTLVFGTILPIARFIFYATLSFLNFLGGLLIGEFRFGALTIFAPLFLLIAAWLIWFFWPTLACFIEDIGWPALNFFFDFLGLVLSLVITILNALIRIWNSLVPVVGFIIYLFISVVTTIFASTVSILGAFDVYALVGALLEVVVLIVEIAIEMIVAVVTLPTGILSEIVEAIGPAVTVVMNAATIWARVLTWVWGVLWQSLEPILETLVSVVRYVKKHFFARALARSLLGLETEPSLRGMSTSDDLGDQMWHIMGRAGSHYWNDERGEHSTKELRGMNAWHERHSPQHVVDYYYMRRTALLGRSGPLTTSRGRSLLQEAELPQGWNVADDDNDHIGMSTAPVHNHEPGKNHPHLQDIWDHMDGRFARADDDLQSHPVPIEEEVESYKVECHSKHCGGHGVPLDHPIKTMARGHKRLRPLDADTPHKRRARMTQTAAMAHVARHTMRHAVHEFWYKGDGTVPRNARHAWKELTGHNTLHETLEYLTTQRKNPVESVATFVPVLSEWQPFAWMLSQHPEEYQRRFLGHHTRHLLDKKMQNQRHLMAEGGDDATTAADPIERHGRIHYLGDAMRHNDRRGIYDPEGNARADDVIANAEEIEEQPAMPFLQLLYRARCYVGEPHNPLCIPEFAPQLPCLAKLLFSAFPDKPPVDLCVYEEECADLGFCIIERPPVTPELIAIFSNPDLWISWCWIRNGILWVLVVVAIIAPVVKLTFRVLSALLPFLSWLFDFFVALIPETVSLQDLVCLVPFFYGSILIVVLAKLFQATVLPLLRFLYRSWISLEAIFGAMRAAESSMLAYKQNSGYATIYRAFYASKPNAVLPFDPWTGQPNIAEPKRREFAEDPEDNMRAQAQRLRVYPSSNYFPYIPLTGGYEPGGDVEAANWQRGELQGRNLSTWAQQPLMAEISPEERAERAKPEPDALDADQKQAVSLYAAGLKRGLAQFGEPARVVTSADVHNFEARWRPFLHSAHWTSAWLHRYINEHHYQREKKAQRAPPVLLGQRGWFAHLF